MTSYFIFLIGLSTLLSSTPTFARLRIKTSETPYTVHLEGTRCEELVEAIEGLKAWSKIFEPGKEKEAKCVTANGQASADVTPLVPRHVLELIAKGKNLQCSGPNCMNTTWIAAGFSIHPRYMGMEESSEILKKCQSRLAGTSPRPGDVAVVVDRSSTQDYEHMFIHIGGGLVLSKDGLDQRFEVKLDNLEAVTNVYGVAYTKDCLFGWHPFCQRYLRFYDCSNQGANLSYPLEWRNLEKEVSCHIYSTSFNSQFTALKQLEKKLIELEKPHPINQSLKIQLLFSKIEHAYLNPSTIDQIELLPAHFLDETLLTRTLTQSITTETAQDRLKKIKTLLEKKADPNQKDQGGRIPLQVAKSIEEVRLLLDHGANVDGDPQDPTTPLMAAIQEQDLEKIAVLLEYGAKTEGPKIPGKLKYKDVLEWAKSTLKNAPAEFFENLDELVHPIAPESTREPESLIQPTVRNERAPRFIDFIRPAPKRK